MSRALTPARISRPRVDDCTWCGDHTACWENVPHSASGEVLCIRCVELAHTVWWRFGEDGSYHIARHRKPGSPTACGAILHPRQPRGTWESDAFRPARGMRCLACEVEVFPI